MWVTVLVDFDALPWQRRIVGPMLVLIPFHQLVELLYQAQPWAMTTSASSTTQGLMR